ncbi:hypothetical protein [Xylophilus sp. ASV27]|uniref:hypothetical protein n=1 Tax=Xylophilus sp. ASV27 TaxID=2795129 RepID=UPI0018EE1648|nr:hypothetical protein [Xylophilus sp. ASV27]
MKIAAIAMAPFFSSGAAAIEPVYLDVVKSIVDSAPPNSKYFHISVGLNVKNSIADLVAGNYKDRMPDFSDTENAVLASIKGEYVESAVWRKNLGGMSLYVTRAGLDAILANQNVRSIMPANERGTIFDPYGDLKKIEQEISVKGVARVNIIPASTAWTWELGRDGMSVFKIREGAVPQAIAAKENIVKVLAPWGIKDYSITGNESVGSGGKIVSLDATINMEGFYALNNRADIVSLRPIDVVGNRVILSNAVQKFDEEALNEAKVGGHATVLIDLKRQPGYLPGGGILGPDVQRSQEESLRKAFDEILAGLSEDGKKSISYFTRWASVAARLSYADLLLLYKNADPRIDRVDLSRPLATVSLNVSTGNEFGSSPPPRWIRSLTS